MATSLLAFIPFLLGLVLSTTIPSSFAHPAQPNIVMIVADDLGWYDVSLHGSTQIPTPNIDKLAREGVILNNYYVMHLCTPTRSAIMTGRHPIHLGLQHKTIAGAQPYGLGLNETTIAQLLKQQGYGTQAIGKWHLGFFAKEYLPQSRGFDNHYGYLLGYEDYWDHTGTDSSYWGYDFKNNSQTYTPVFGQYSTELYTSHAKDVITKHNKSQPLFLYVAQQAVHAGNGDMPMEAPWKYVQQFPNITDKKRQIFAGMVSALDDSVGNITTYLKDSGLYENTVIIFTTDNGGAGNGYDGSVGCNWPLRGMKSTLWEGGVRGIGFVNSPLLAQPGRVSEGLIHVSDWFPTMYRLAGGNVSSLGTNIYGVDVWDTISKGSPSPRNEILLNIDPIEKYAALRLGDYKIIIGDTDFGIWDSWFPPLGVAADSGRDYHENETNAIPSGSSSGPSPVVKCLTRPSNASYNCKPVTKPCLFNIKNDPCEFYNVADWNQDILNQLLARVHKWNATAVPPLNANLPLDPNANPDLHNGNWVPWVVLNNDNFWH